MAHLGNRKPALAQTAIKAIPGELSLNTIKAPRRRHQSSQQGQQLENAVGNRSVRMQNLREFPLRLDRLPGPAVVQDQPELIGAELRKLDDRAMHSWLDAERLELLRKTPRKCRKRFLLAAEFFWIMDCDLKTVFFVKAVIGERLRQNQRAFQHCGKREQILVGLNLNRFGNSPDPSEQFGPQGHAAGAQKGATPSKQARTLHGIGLKAKTLAKNLDLLARVFAFRPIPWRVRACFDGVAPFWAPAA